MVGMLLGTQSRVRAGLGPDTWFETSVEAGW